MHTRHGTLAAFAVAMIVTGGAAPTLAGDGDQERVVAAAKARNGLLVQRLLARGADPNVAQPDGATALHWAASWSDPDTVARLIAAGANVNAANDLGVTPLFLASANGGAAVAGALLEAGADPNVGQMRGATPLMEAARAGHSDVIRALLHHHADVNARESTHDQTALMWAAAHRQPAAVRALLDGGADITARSRIRRRKAFVNTQRGGSYQPGAFEKHVADGDIIEVDEGGYTPLLFAVQQGDTESATLLLDAGADVNDTAPIGMSALVVAAYSNQPAVGRLLLERGAAPDAAVAGYSALHAAILRGSPVLVNDLIEHGADVNQRITKPSGARRQSADYALGTTLVGATPVYLAAKFAEIPILRALIAAHADTALPLPNGSTPLIAAMETERINSLGGEGLGEDRRDRNVFFRAYNVQSATEIEDDVLALAVLLTRDRVELNAADRAGNTALHVAARAGLNRVVEHLVSQGADINLRNRRRETPLQVAEAPRRNRGGDVFAGHIDTAALLRRLGGTD